MCHYYTRTHTADHMESQMLAQHALLAFDPQSNHQVFGNDAQNAVSDAVRQGLNLVTCRISWNFSFDKLSCLFILVDLSRPLAASQRSVW